MKRAALYLRVSTLDQHPETQLYDLRQLAQQRGYEIVQEYTDKISGAKAKRPGLDQLMADARHGQFQVVVVWAFDRLARSVRHFLDVLSNSTYAAKSTGSSLRTAALVASFESLKRSLKSFDNGERN
jgi:DNA invertase Pin-like site-specific DNA recombinase